MLMPARQWAADVDLPIDRDADLLQIWAAASARGIAVPGLAFASWAMLNGLGGPPMSVLVRAPDAEELLVRWARLHPFSGAETVAYRRTATLGVLDQRAATGGPAHPESATACFAIVVGLLTRLGADPASLYVTLRRPTPSDRMPFARAFAHVRFDGDADQLAVPAVVLETPSLLSVQDVLAVMDSYAGEQLRRRRPSWTARVVDVIRAYEDADLGSVARRLAVSRRALQQYLRAEGTSYSELVDRRRRHQALTLLGSTGLSATQVADRVGLGSHAALNRAVKRWTGLSPTAYRTSRR
jgi:AraC-like DNA-binding protein